MGGKATRKHSGRLRRKSRRGSGIAGSRSSFTNGLFLWVQIIVILSITPEEYVSEAFQRKIPPPPVCPHCNGINALPALGYYERNLSRTGPGILRLWIRRFRCRDCGRTVSMLPEFVQPYRIVRNATIEEFFRGQPFKESVSRWLGPLRSYRLRFQRWLPEIKRTLQTACSQPLAESEILRWWSLLVSNYVDFGSATQATVSDFQITFFGRYRCHLPNPPKNRMPLRPPHNLSIPEDPGM